MAIADKLTQLNNVKLAIKNALISKEVDMTNVPFTEYASKISEISMGVDLSNVKFLYAGSNGSSGSVTIESGKTVIAIIGVQDYYSSADKGSSIKFTIGSTTYTCSTSNGIYKEQNQFRATQKATRTMIWINSGSYKSSTFAKASFSGGWGDGVNQLFVLYI